jgi:bifunctional non-homologous end joining protein LigD
VPLRSRCCIIDSEAVALGEDGTALFERIHYRRHDGSVFLYAFDLIELNGDDLRREPLKRRKAMLRRLLVRAGRGVRSTSTRRLRVRWSSGNACRMGLEGIRDEAQGLVVSVRSLAGLGEGEEPQGARSDAIGRGSGAKLLSAARRSAVYLHVPFIASSTAGSVC